jgi:hypothetical protein
MISDIFLTLFVGAFPVLYHLYGVGGRFGYVEFPAAAFPFLVIRTNMLSGIDCRVIFTGDDKVSK